MEAGLFVLFVLVALAGFFISIWLKDQRRKAFASTAASLGLTYSSADPFGLVDLPFELFGRGRRRGAENVLYGTWHDIEVRVFDHWYYVERTDADGTTSRDYTKFTAAIATVPLDAPHTLVGRETVLTRLADAVGLRDIEFESEEFNRRMQIKSADRRFASYLIDARMMEWLMETSGAFELNGSLVLLYGDRVDPAQVSTVLSVLEGFVRQIPRVALDAYGATR